MVITMKEVQDKIAKSLFGRGIEEAKYGRVCVACGRPAMKFKDDLSLREYEISAMCQKCQDDVFQPDVEIEEKKS